MKDHNEQYQGILFHDGPSVIESSGIDSHKFFPQHKSSCCIQGKAEGCSPGSHFGTSAGAQQRLFGSFIISLLHLLTILWHLQLCQSSSLPQGTHRQNCFVAITVFFPFFLSCYHCYRLDLLLLQLSFYIFSLVVHH